MAEGKMGPLFSTVPGNELENEGRGTTPPSQDPLHSSFGPSLSLSPSIHVVWIQLRCMNLAGYLNRPTICHCVSPDTPLSVPPQADLTWLAEPNLLSPSFKLNLLSAPLKACLIGEGLVDSFKPHILSLMLQSTECWRIMLSSCCHYPGWLRKAVIWGRWCGWGFALYASDLHQ